MLSAVLAALLLLTFAACTDSSKEGNGSTDEGFTGKTEEPVEVSILCGRCHGSLDKYTGGAECSRRNRL